MSTLDLQLAISTIKQGRHYEGLSLLLESRLDLNTKEELESFETNLWFAGRKILDDFFMYFQQIQSFTDISQLINATIKLLKLLDFISMFQNLEMQISQNLYDKKEKKEISSIFTDFFSKYLSFLEKDLKNNQKFLENLLLYPFLVEDLAIETNNQLDRFGITFSTEMYRIGNNRLLQEVIHKFHLMLDAAVSNKNYLYARRYNHIINDLFQRTKLKKYPFVPGLEKLQNSIYIMQANFEEQIAIRHSTEKLYLKALEHIQKATEFAEKAGEEKKIKLLDEKKTEIKIAYAYNLLEYAEKCFRQNNFPEITDSFRKAIEILTETNQKKHLQRGQDIITDLVRKIVDYFLAKAKAIETVSLETADEKNFFLYEAYSFALLGYDDKLKLKIREFIDENLEKKIPMYLDLSKKQTELREYEKAYVSLMNAYDIAKCLRDEKTMERIFKKFKPLNEKIPYDLRLKLEDKERIEQEDNRLKVFESKKKEYESKIVIKDKAFIPTDSEETRITEIINKFETSKLLQEEEIALLRKYSFNLPIQQRYFNPNQKVDYKFILKRNLTEKLIVCCIPNKTIEEEPLTIHINLAALAYDFLFYVPELKKSANASKVLQDILNYAINNKEFVLYKGLMKGTKFEFFLDYIEALANAFITPESIIITEQFLRNLDEKIDAMAFMNIIGMAILAKKPFILSWNENDAMSNEAAFYALTTLSIINGKFAPALTASGLIDKVIHKKVHLHQKESE